MKQLIFNLKIPQDKISDLKMIFRSMRLSSNLAGKDIKFSLLEDLKNRRSKMIVVEWNNGMEWFEVWNRNVFYAIVKSVGALADEYDYEMRSINVGAGMRTKLEPEMVGV